MFRGLDYFLYGHRTGYINLWTILIDFTILVYTLCNWRSLLQTENLLLLLFLLFTSVIWQIGCFVRDFYSYTHKTAYYEQEDELPHPAPAIDEEVRQIYSAPDVHFQDTVLIYSEAINHLLQSDRPVQVVLSTHKKRQTENYIRAYRDILLPFLNGKWHAMRNRGKSFFNERKLCMGSEFTECNGMMTVKVCQGNYFNSYLTNFIYTRKLFHQSGLDLDAPANAADYPIRKIEKSVMSDHIGISTLALSSDGYVLILRQNDKTIMQANRLTPSGSGSINYEDFRQDADFRETLRTAVERELREESGLKPEQIAHTEVIGFYRDLERGGKPEFCCLTHLRADLSQIEELKPNRREQRDDFETFHILGNTGALDGRDAATLADKVLGCSDRKALPSLALYMCWFMLCLYYGKKS